MLRDDVELVRKIVKEEIALALAALNPVKVAKVETPKPVEVEVKTGIEVPSKKVK
jgi:hypothetical protein